MSAGQGRSTDPIINDDDEEEKEEDLIKEFSQMTVKELPKDLQRLIFQYKFKDETVEDRKLIHNYFANTIDLNQNLLDRKQEQVNIYDNLYVDQMFSEDETKRNELQRQMNNVGNQINSLAFMNDALLETYGEQVGNYMMRYTNFYRHRDKYG